MTAYEQHLLALAVEWCAENGVSLQVDARRTPFTPYAGTLDDEGDPNGHHRDTLAGALAALLDEAGVEFPGSAMTGPVLSMDLYRIENLRLEKEVQDALALPLSRLIESAADSIGQMLRDAYVNGLRDGFAQGVSSAARPYEEGGEA